MSRTCVFVCEGGGGGGGGRGREDRARARARACVCVCVCVCVGGGWVFLRVCLHIVYVLARKCTLVHSVMQQKQKHISDMCTPVYAKF